MADPRKTVLITGCSTGIGRALALEFHRHGLRVFATARNPESLKDLAAMGMETLTLDVNSSSDIDDAVKAVDSLAGGLDILVNNAGFIAMGPLAEIPLDRVRLQFETNVVAVLAMTQAFVPVMIRKGGGRIVNIGSVSGVLATPFAGAYCASKSAVHALSDVLRAELAPFNISVITVQPGGIESELGNTAHKGIPEVKGGKSLYSAIASAIEERALASQNKATPVKEFAEKLVPRLLEEKPAPVIRLGHQSFLLPLIRYALPTSWRDRLLRKKFSLDLLNEPGRAQIS